MHRYAPAGTAAAPDGKSLHVRVLMLSWRDAQHPEAGGSETFVERVSGGLVDVGHSVTVVTSGHPGAASDQDVNGVRHLRLGGRYSVFARAAGYLARHGREYDVILDIQNGVPFWTPVFTRTPVVVVVHHVHREQWPEVFDPVRARLGWWLESRIAPRIYRKRPYVTVSDATRRELVQLGVAEERVTVVYSGNDLPSAPDVARSAHPSLVVLGRLVPHKRVELALEALAQHLIRYPDLELTVVGHGYWEPELYAAAEELGVRGSVRFLGFVDDDTKHEVLARSWVHVLPSVKEGWGLVVVEAGFHGTPTVAFRDAGGTAESVVDGVTGLLADDDEGLVAAVGLLLGDGPRRDSLGTAARVHARQFNWEATSRGVEAALLRAADRPERATARRR